MNESERIRQAQRYLRAPEKGFWKWSDDGEVALWSTGATIAFKKELAEILTIHVEQGLPPFGAILLLIGATRESWRNISSHTEKPKGKGDSPAFVSAKELLGDVMKLGSNPTELESFDTIISGLNVVHELENDVRFSINAKQTLIDLVLEDADNRISPIVSAEVIQLLDRQEYLFQDEHSYAMSPMMFVTIHGTDTIKGDFRALKKGLPRVSNSVLRMRRETGLDSELTQLEEVELPHHPAATVRQLLDEMENDRELCGMAAAARQLMSVVTIPKPIDQPDELPQGGFSDITNRGPLDRLLLSELANDDLTLAVRVAMNEAMYLRRETPPRIATRKRMIVLDSGIRMWGIPRTISTAFGLALIAGTDESVQLESYSSRVAELNSIDLTTRDGLIGHLKTLESELHVGKSLERLSVLSNPRDQATDPAAVDRILVTSPEAMEDPEFIQLMANADVFPIYIATVDREGQTVLFEISNKGRKEIRRAKIDVNDVINRQPKQSLPIVDENIPIDLPAALRSDRFPLRLANASNFKRAWTLGKDNGALAMTADRQLCYWDKVGRGGLQIAQTLVPGDILWHSKEIRGSHAYAVIGAYKGTGIRILKFNVDTLEHECYPIELDKDRSPPKGFVGVADRLFGASHRRVDSFNLDTGHLIGSRLMEQAYWHRDRFFRDNENWYALSVTELDNKLEQIPNKKGFEFIDFFECDGIDGPIGITKSGELFFTHAEELLFEDDPWAAKILKGNAQLIEVAPDGSELILMNRQDFRMCQGNGIRINVRQRRADFCYRQTLIKNHVLGRQIHEIPLRKNFNAISILEEDEAHLHFRQTKSSYVEELMSGLVLSLSSPKHPRIDLFADVNFGVQMVSIEEGTNLILRKKFQRIGSPSDSKIVLHEVRWGESRAVLDSRGFLHLQSSNQDVPELTIALSDGVMSAWASDGRVWGNKYFFVRDDHTLMTNDELYEILQIFLVRLGMET